MVAKEEAVPSGWENMVAILEETIPTQEKILASLQGDSADTVQGRKIVSGKLVSVSEILFCCLTDESRCNQY